MMVRHAGLRCIMFHHSVTCSFTTRHIPFNIFYLLAVQVKMVYLFYLATCNIHNYNIFLCTICFIDLYTETLGSVETEVEIDDFNATSSSTIWNPTEIGNDNCPQHVTLVMFYYSYFS